VKHSIAVNSCWSSPTQSFLVSAQSGPMDKFLFFPRSFIYLEMGSPLRREEGLVFLSRRHICYTVIQHECTHTHAASRVRLLTSYGHHTHFATLLE
jgi:hypothetical protein